MTTTITDSVDHYITFIHDNYLKTTGDAGQADPTTFIQAITNLKNINSITQQNQQNGLINTQTSAPTLSLDYDVIEQCFRDNDDVLISEYKHLVDLQTRLKVFKDAYDSNGSSFTFQGPIVDASSNSTFSSINALANTIYDKTINEEKQKEYYYRSFGVFLDAVLSLVNSTKLFLNEQIFKQHIAQLITHIKDTVSGMNTVDFTNSMLDHANIQKLSENYQSSSTEINIIQQYLSEITNETQRTRLEEINDNIVMPLGENIKKYINHILNENNKLQDVGITLHKEYDTSRDKLRKINNDLTESNSKSREMSIFAEHIDRNASYYNTMLYLVVGIVIIVLVAMLTSLNNSYGAKMSILYACVAGLVAFYVFYAISMHFLVVEGFSSSGGSSYVSGLIERYMYLSMITLQNSASNSFYVNTVMPAIKREEKKYNSLKVASASHFNKQRMYINDRYHSMNKDRAMIDLIVGMVTSTIVMYMVYLTIPENTFLVVALGVLLFSLFLSIYFYTTQKRTNSSYKHMYFSM